uniref:Protein kinase domain-containing protein n=1 Tax=Panagrolaimus sp. ES5 TaxID=591445 RepID=A0AC34GP99_9BILA
MEQEVYLHRDVKPGNYTVGRADLNELRKVYVLDFGMARKFIHDDGTMKKPRTAAGFRGTVRYAALSCHLQREMCRKDDIESWLYMCIEITRGKLPWRNLEDQDEVGVFKKECRKEKSIKQLFGGCPRQFIEIIKLCDSWKFFDQPDYAKIYKLMKEAIVSTKSEEFPYDWEPEAIKKAEEKAKAKRVSGKKGSTSSDSDKKKEESEKKKKKDDKEKKEKDESDKKHSEKKHPLPIASSEKVKNPRRATK